MKGIILAGGKGTRLYPLTMAVSKQLLPVYDKPMIYYPLSLLMLSGIKDILIITTPEDQESYRKLLGCGSQWGVSFTFIKQYAPNGLAEAFILGRDFIGNDSVCLILGDNIFYGNGLQELLNIEDNINGGIIFAYPVRNPSAYGVVEFDANRNAVAIEEKPKNPKSNYAVPGIYFYDNNVIDIATNLKPSARGEIEITDINNEYLQKGLLKVKVLSRGFAWLDAGVPESLLQASNFIQTVQERQGLMIACLEEIAFEKGWINRKQIENIAEQMKQCEYGQYLLSLLKE